MVRTALDASSWIQRQIVNLFLLVLLSAFVLDVIPTKEYQCFHFLSQIQKDLDWYLDVTGLWQGPYYLFAPTPKNQNTRISAQIVYPENSNLETRIVYWKSPKWQGMKPWQKW
jgi:hypothetical protein